MALILQDVSIAAVASLNGEGCAKGCAEAEECAFAVVSTLGDEAAPLLYVNESGGQHDSWTATALTDWATEDPTDVFGVKSFIMVINGGETLPLARSQDKGTSITYLAGHADMVANEPYAGDMLSPDMIVIVGANGYVWLSTDYGQTFTTVDSGGATTEDLTKVQICRQNSAVIYAIGANNALIKSENGGYTWFALTGPSATDALTAIEILNENDILIGNDDGELWESSDGGDSWTQQADLPDLPAAASLNAISCCSCGPVDKAGVCYAIIEDTAAAEHVVYRNAGFGSAQWEVPQGGGALTEAPADIVCCENNRALVVGGDGVNEGFTGLIS